MVATNAAAGIYDAALTRRQALMGKSGPAALIKNFRVFSIAMFACIGGYNQGVFSGVLTMPAFQSHMGDYDTNNPADQSRKGWLTSILELGAGTNYIGGTGAGQSEAAWLVPICLQLFPAIILFTGILFMPYSPRWLIHHDREAQALTVLSTLRGLPPDHELVELEFLEIKAQSIFEKRTIAENWPKLTELTAWNTAKLQFVAIGSLFTTKAMFRRVIVATVTMFFQQWTGINAILYYAPTIFASLGLSSNTVSLLATGVVGIVMFLATIPSVLYIDKLGRKPILTIGAIGMATCHMIIAIIVARDQDSWTKHSAAGWGAVAMVWLFVIHFGYSWGPCAWIIVAEIWPLSNRPYGIALGASSNWMNNFIVGQVTPDMITGITYGTYLIFGLLTFGGAAFIHFFVPETKRLTLEEMDVIFGSEGTAAKDFERMEAINREIGLVQLLGGVAGEGKGEANENASEAENGKEGVVTEMEKV
ncbi:hypothetical protein B7494_g4667 [Chlorociboria aeruginascens]|nr:hypothetical protein B7494_g4667 [Chlorociboria aeruginascens]